MKTPLEGPENFPNYFLRWKMASMYLSGGLGRDRLYKTAHGGNIRHKINGVRENSPIYLHFLSFANPKHSRSFLLLLLHLLWRIHLLQLCLFSNMAVQCRYFPYFPIYTQYFSRNADLHSYQPFSFFRHLFWSIRISKTCRIWARN